MAFYTPPKVVTSGYEIHKIDLTSGVKKQNITTKKKPVNLGLRVEGNAIMWYYMSPSKEEAEWSAHQYRMGETAPPDGHYLGMVHHNFENIFVVLYKPETKKEQG